jgi:hypothetical protein
MELCRDKFFMPPDPRSLALPRLYRTPLVAELNRDDDLTAAMGLTIGFPNALKKAPKRVRCSKKAKKQLTFGCVSFERESVLGVPVPGNLYDDDGRVHSPG